MLAPFCQAYLQFSAAAEPAGCSAATSSGVLLSSARDSIGCSEPRVRWGWCQGSSIPAYPFPKVCVSLCVYALATLIIFPSTREVALLIAVRVIAAWHLWGSSKQGSCRRRVGTIIRVPTPNKSQEPVHLAVWKSSRPCHELLGRMPAFRRQNRSFVMALLVPLTLGLVMQLMIMSSALQASILQEVV